MKRLQLCFEGEPLCPEKDWARHSCIFFELPAILEVAVKPGLPKMQLMQHIHQEIGAALV
jgi:hypothetical protein